MLSAIYASKMYRASTRKDKIKAAAADPTNQELVTQIADYLDDEYKTAKYFPQEDKSEKHEDRDISNHAVDDNKDSAPPRPSRMPGGSGLGEQIVDDLPEGPEDVIDDVPEELTSEDVEVENVLDESAVSESIRVTSSSIDAAVTTQTSGFNIDIVNEIKGLLNTRSETAGVSRVRIKDNELWIHYEDKINLNNVMSAVIDLINASAYTYLDFNRLARSENAVVFEIQDYDSAQVGEKSDVKE